MAHLHHVSDLVPRSRAYQLEMFHHSLQSNTIVVMGTGTGKTHIASLRIHAELGRNPTKHIWFTAPNAGLVDQQCRYLASQLPQYCLRSLTGRDNVDMWGSAVWEKILSQVNVVVATPQVLLDALHHAYVKLQSISLLVFDEAHHCQARTPSALIMQTFYHPQKRLTGAADLPSILGLTASPRISEQSASLHQVQSNLDATCRWPTISTEEYVQHLHKATLVRRCFTHVAQECSSLLQCLRQIVAATEMCQDPYYLQLMSTAETDPKARVKLTKCQRSCQTPAMGEITRFLGSAEHLHQSLGTWASDLYITTCLSQWKTNAPEINQYHDAHSSHHQRFIDSRLAPLRAICQVPALLCDAHVSAKALELIRFLVAECRKGIAIIIFVERRAAAWALCRLLQADPRLASYGIFSYVGSSVGKAVTLHEGCAAKKQEMEFMGFRDGLRNICIATSVAEEGIDVPAVDTVVRFDDPKQLTSYVQSRGRARRKDSKIVCFQDTNEELGKYEDWNRLEKEMEELYSREVEEAQQRLEIEQIVEYSDEMYQVHGTGARLDLNVSVSRLAHFCAKVSIPADPVYILEGELGRAISAKVLLPSSVPPPIRQAHSCRTWRSERMARRDAAFHAMKALHEAGLTNDHLVPFEVEDTPVPLMHEKKMRQIPPEHRVWLADDNDARRFAYRIEIKHEENKYLSLILILSTQLLQATCFPISESFKRRIDVVVVPVGQVEVPDVDDNDDVTRFLFEAVFQVGSASSSLEDHRRISCILVPGLGDAQLGKESVDLTDFLKQHGWLLDSQPLLIWRKSRPRPYVWYPPHLTQESVGNKPTLVAKQVRKLQIFARSLNAAAGQVKVPQDKEISLDECETRGIASVHGPTVLLLPTILHYIATAIRAQHAGQTVLRPIGFSSMEHIIPALIAKSASGMYNYERLEFLGDACLKYLASVQMFFDHPIAPEGILTRKTHEIIGNTRLERATNEIGLATFITTEIPTQKHWKLPSIQAASEEEEPRSVLSKTLADVVESILGAAYLDGVQNGQADERCISTLRLFVPEIPWHTPEVHIAQTNEYCSDDAPQSLLQQMIKQMLDCDVDNPALLAEALTHSTDDVSQSALDRLEFLGDAILDQVVKIKLFEYHDLDAYQLTVRRHALVSHAFLAYLALGVHYDKILSDVCTNQDGTAGVIAVTKRVELTDLIKSRQTSTRDPITAARTQRDNVRHKIESELMAGRFPWTLLRSLDAPKVCSDIVESLLAALYLSSRGSLSRCQELLDRLGMMELLKQMATNANFEVRTPATTLRELCAEHNIAVSIKARCEQDHHGSRYIGQVCLDEKVTITRTASCLEEARSLVAEAARDFLLFLQQSNHAALEDESENLGTDLDADIVMSEAAAHES